MTLLGDRLRQIVRAGPGGSASRQDAPSAPGVPNASTAGGLEEALGGAWTPDGRSFVVERRVSAGAAYGRCRVGQIGAGIQRAAGEARLLGAGAPARPPFVFFDLETTGLSGGAGTHAFLVGYGWFTGDGAWVTWQHLLARHDLERPMLERVEEAFSGAGALVSFNGKSFDAPFLETRYLFHRLEWAGSRLPHLDVLHPARRFWGDRGAARLAPPSPGCSLIALEQQILGARREGDVAGFEIPSRYFQFVRTGDARPLSAVFEHNRLDLLSLAGLTARLLELVADGPGAAGDAREALALGRLYARAGLDGRAGDAFRHVTDAACAADHQRIDGLRELAAMLRRRRRHEEAAECWRRLLEIGSCPRHMAREANEALAIHHEHRVRDLAAAKAFALQSLERVEGEEEGAVRHRLARLERKLTTAASGRPLFPSWSSRPRPSSGSRKSARRTSS